MRKKQCNVQTQHEMKCSEFYIHRHAFILKVYRELFPCCFMDIGVIK